MSIILPEQFMKEAVERSFDVISDDLKWSVGGVYVPQHKLVEHVGSCVFVKIRGSEYIVTAAHVLRDSPSDGLVIGDLRSAGPFTGEFKIFRRSDLLDVAIARVPRKLRSYLTAAKFYDLDWCLQRPAVWVPRRCVIFGLPHSKNKRLHQEQLPMQRRQFGFLALPAETQFVDGLPHINAKTHMVLDWTPDEVMTSSGGRWNPPSLKGMSGGAVIDLGNLEAEDVMAGLRTPQPLVEGIVSLWRKKQKVVGVRFKTMIELLDRTNGWPAPLEETLE